MLAERVVATEPGEKLDEKLAALTFKNQQEQITECLYSYLRCAHILSWSIVQYLRQAQTSPHGGIVQVSLSCPLWSTHAHHIVEHPDGVFPITQSPVRGPANPFDSAPITPLSCSPSSSDEELYRAASLPSQSSVPPPFSLPRKVPPPPPPRRSVNSTTS
jgi:hypothetical protein